MSEVARCRGRGWLSDEREYKLVVDREAARRVVALARARLGPDPTAEVSLTTYVRTTYYDTGDFAYYRSSVEPVARRLRVREYATSASAGVLPELGPLCYVELKESAGGRRRKLRIAVPARQVDAQLADLAGRPVTAQMSSWYRRRAFTGGAERLRLTLDERLLFCRPVRVGTSFADYRPSLVLAAGPRFVLEVKLGQDLPPWLANELDWGSAPGPISKFLLGMAAAQAAGLLSLPALAGRGHASGSEAPLPAPRALSMLA